MPDLRLLLFFWCCRVAEKKTTTYLTGLQPILTNSNNPQAPVQIQLAVTLYCLGCYGNGASWTADILEGSVENYTNHYIDAIKELCNIFVWPLTQKEEIEKKWIDEHLVFQGSWWDGWIMYDGTIVVLYSWPGLHGDAYYTRKGNYGLNLQVSNAGIILKKCLCLDTITIVFKNLSHFPHISTMPPFFEDWSGGINFIPPWLCVHIFTCRRGLGGIHRV